MSGLIYLPEGLAYCDRCGAPAVVRIVAGVPRYFHNGPCRPRGWRERSRRARAARRQARKRRRRYA
jgi:hypothetical protein